MFGMRRIAHAGLFDKAPQPIILEATADRATAFSTLFLNENMMARDQNKPYDGPQESGAMVKAMAKNSGTTILSKGTADTFTMTGYSKGAALAKALGATTIHANLIIGFAKLANSGSFRSAEVAHGVKLSLSPQSMFMVMGDDGSIKQFQFRQEVVLPSQIGAKVVDVGRTGGHTALLVFNALAGGSSGSIINFEVTVVDNYREMVLTGLRMVAEVLAQGLKKN
jgi:hypothetical protein